MLFVDYEINPGKDTAPSIDLLGKVLNREENAKAYTDYYRQQLDAIRQKTANITPKANVFVEALAGNSDACCFTHGHNGWGGLVEAVGANNIGSQLLPGASGFVSLEKVISMKPVQDAGIARCCVSVYRPIPRRSIVRRSGCCRAPA